MGIPAEHLGDAVNQAVDRFHNATLRDTLEEIERVLERDAFGANFALSAAADGTPWAPHAPSTVARYGKHPLLILSGDLFLSVTSNFGAHHISRIDGRTLETGTDLVYAAVHQYGWPERNIPARPYLDASAEVLEHCREMAADGLFAEMSRGLTP